MRLHLTRQQQHGTPAHGGRPRVKKTPTQSDPSMGHPCTEAVPETLETAAVRPQHGTPLRRAAQSHRAFNSQTPASDTHTEGRPRVKDVTGATAWRQPTHRGGPGQNASSQTPVWDTTRGGQPKSKMPTQSEPNKPITA